MYKIAITYTPYLTKILAALAATVAVSVFLYGIFLLEAVGNTAERSKAEREIRNISSRVSSLEQEYLSKTRGLTLERAKELGFVLPEQVVTVFATAGVKSLGRAGQGTEPSPSAQ